MLTELESNHMDYITWDDTSHNQTLSAPHPKNGSDKTANKN